jgi:hypothetical protein
MPFGCRSADAPTKASIIDERDARNRRIEAAVATASLSGL